MLFRQYQLGCLSLFSYLIGDSASGKAVVVDPQRDISQYVADAEAAGVTIEKVIETHFHADFVSGHLELASAVGASICYGQGARAEYPIEELADRDRIALGEVELEIRATPGHTPESISIVVLDRGEPWGVLTGDTLFIGDVGRPDLLASAGWSSEQLARRLYRSLHDQLLSLPDTTRVFPAHGAGSACGKNMSTAVESTIGVQRTTNYALRTMSEDEFVAAVTEGQPVAPLYFPFAADTNRRQRGLLGDHEPPPALDLDGVMALRDAGAVVIDGRAADVFASGHLRGSINVPLEGRFAEYAGDVARPGDDIVVVADRGREIEAKVRLARIGFDRVQGALVDLESGLLERPELAAAGRRISWTEAAQTWLGRPGLQLVDVRNPSEHADGVLDGSTSLPMPALLDHLHELDPARPALVYCASGVRSPIAASVLRARGFGEVVDVFGGFDAWRQRG